MFYRKVLKSFLYWSGKFSADRSEQPFNAILMIAACQVLLLVALALFYEYATASLLPLSGLSLTILSVLLLFANLYLFRHGNVDKMSDISNAKVRFLAPLFASFCIFMLIFSVICGLSRKGG